MKSLDTCDLSLLDLTYISKQTPRYGAQPERPFSSSDAVRHFYAIFTGPYQPLLVLTSSSQVFVTQSSLSTFLLSRAILGISSDQWASTLSFSLSIVTRKYKTVFLFNVVWCCHKSSLRCISITVPDKWDQSH